MIRRREFVTGLGSAAAWPVAAPAQQAERVRHVGVLMNVVREDPGGPADVMAFRQGLADLGWIEGRNIGIEFRWPGGDIERVRTFAKELVGLRPDVLIGPSTPTTAALSQETGTIPIIFVNVPEPVEQGFVQSLAWPGGNITGFTNFEASVGGKWLHCNCSGGRPAHHARRRDLQSADGAVRRIVLALGRVGRAHVCGGNGRYADKE